MPICPICQTDLSDNEQFCPLCGRARDTIPRETMPSDDTEALTGIDGWLILIVIGLIIGSFSNTIIGVQSVLLRFDFFSSLEIAMGAFCVVCLVFMFIKSRLFPKLYIALLCINLLVALFALIVISVMHENGKTEYVVRLLVTAASSIIWGTYILRSKRVKNTFIK